MTLHAAGETLSWNELSARVEALVAAWRHAAEPPSLGDFTPPASSPLRQVVLTELIKVDLANRWRDGRWQKTIEQYVAEFPELESGGGVPCDLMYEEFHIRRQAGESPVVDDYLARFPRQADELARLLALDSPLATSTLVVAGRAKPPEVGQSVDDFDILSLLGRGAFASVFLAHQRSMQRVVALKVSADRGAEPQTMAQLDHPHIVRVFDQRRLEERGLRLLYMQHVAGGTLREAMDVLSRVPESERRGATYLAAIDAAAARRGESPPAGSAVRHRLQKAAWPQVVCWVGARLAGALAYAHERGILHRDIKPANILLAADGGPKLADFNTSFSSKLTGATPAAYFGGSLAYMSPEQLEACDPRHARQPETLDARSDIYSLGVVLWEMLAGVRPFPETSLSGDWSEMLHVWTAERKSGVREESLARLPAELPGGLREVLAKCLAPDAESRYASAEDLARELELCLQPAAHRLLRSRAGFLRSLPRRYPLTALSLAGILPNAVMSGLNIAHNLNQIVEPLSDSDRRVFLELLAAVNGAVYAVGLAVALAVIWPVVSAIRRIAAARPVERDMAAVRRRCLVTGDAAAAIAGCLWVVTGLAFPALMQASGPSQVETRQYVLFLTAQIITGLVAATQTFFLVTLMAVRCHYPPLVAAQAPQPAEVVPLVALARRTWIYFGLSVSAPFLAVILVVALGLGQDVITVLGGVGLAAFATAFWMSLAIRGDVATLGSLVNPAGDSLSLSGDTADSFWTGSR